MELIKAYPIIFAFTVVLPVLGGLVGAYMGWDSLKNRHEDQVHKQHVESELTSINKHISPISDQITIIQRYERSLAESNHKDLVVTAVLGQYKKMKSALESIGTYRGRGSKNETEKEALGENILNLLSSELMPVKTLPNHPNQPLIINMAPNIFKVLFSVPMRIPPELTITGIPEDVTPQIVEKTQYGFTVQFENIEKTILSFGFEADARYKL